MNVPLPKDETARLASLAQYEILDTLPEPQFDDLAFLAAYVCEVPIALVTLIDEKRQWIKARVGVEIDETSRDTAFCAYTILDPHRIMEVHDAQTDPRFADNPFVKSDPHLRFYTGAPLLASDGQPIGSLCVMDLKPRALTQAQLKALAALSRAVSSQLELRRQAMKIAKEGRTATQLLAVAEKSRRALLSVLEDEKLAARKLRTSEERFRQLIENSSDVIMVLDWTGRIGYQSPSTLRILGYPPDEMTGRNILEIVHPDDRGTADQGLQQAMRGEEMQRPWEFRIRREDGGWRIFQSVGKGMNDSTGIAKIVVNLRDVTETKEMEEKFMRAQRMEAIGNLASGIAHDLNNILTPMLMVAGMLKETRVEQKERDMLTMVERSAQRGAGIISQLLAFSRGVEGARIGIRPQLLLKEVTHLARETFPRNIEIKETLPDDLWSVVVDATQMHQVLLNLCVNARDAMPDGGELALGAANVRLRRRDVQAQTNVAPGPYVLITVRDTGEGIPPAIMGRIFDPFFTTKGIGKGTGLGLSTVIGIVKSHGGFVTVESVRNQGTEFLVYLPAIDAVEEKERVETAPPVSIGNGELILLVDDEPHILSAVRELLEQHRYRVLIARNGEEAIKVFVEHGGGIRVVVTDMMMPVMGGAALLHTLRLLSPAIKIIATTGLENRELTAESDALGITKTLAKPFSPSALLQALGDCLNG